MFFKKYLFLYQQLSCPLQINPPSNIIHLLQLFFQSSKHFWNAPFGIANSSCFHFSFISTIVAKRFPFVDVFSFGNRTKNAGAKYGEYGGWDIIAVLFLVKNSSTSIDVLGGALSWCKIHEWFFHNSARFFKTVFFFVRTTLWQEFMMHYVVAIEENSEQNLHIWPNLAVLALLNASIGMIGLWFQYHSHTHIIRHQLWPFWANLNRRWTSSTSHDVHATLFS